MNDPLLLKPAVSFIVGRYFGQEKFVGEPECRKGYCRIFVAPLIKEDFTNRFRRN